MVNVVRYLGLDAVAWISFMLFAMVALLIAGLVLVSTLAISDGRRRRRGLPLESRWVFVPFYILGTIWILIGASSLALALIGFLEASLE